MCTIDKLVTFLIHDHQPFTKHSKRYDLVIYIQCLKLHYITLFYVHNR